MNWLPYPRTGTHFQDGRWLCTVEIGTTLQVEILDLESGSWFRNVTERLTDRERVTAVTWVPEPAGEPVRKEARHAARTRALVGTPATAANLARGPAHRATS